MSDQIHSRSGAIVPQVVEGTPKEYAWKCRNLADDIESGRVKIESFTVTKVGKGGSHWQAVIDWRNEERI